MCPSKVCSRIEVQLPDAEDDRVELLIAHLTDVLVRERIEELGATRERQLNEMHVTCQRERSNRPM